MLYYIIGYMQLFGYGVWGTLWRQGFIYIGIVALTGGVIIGCFGFDLNGLVDQTNLSEQEIMASRFLIAGGAIIFGLGTLLVGFLINLIATRKARKQMKLDEMLNRQKA